MPINRKISTHNSLSQKCLPGGPQSATYDPSTYTYLSDNIQSNTYPLQPSILALDGDTQVGGYNHNSASNDPNYNRNQNPSPHVVTEKAFYTELAPNASTNQLDLGSDIPRNQTFLRVDLTEGGKVFRHNAVIVKGSIHCTTQQHFSIYDLNPATGPGPRLFALYDFEFYFVCNPLHSNYQPDGVTDSEYVKLDRLKTLSACYFYARNRSYGDDSLSIYNGNGSYGAVLSTPLFDFGGGIIKPTAHWAEFALTSETGADPYLNELHTVPGIHRQLDTNPDSLFVTPVTANLTTDPNVKFDLNHVNFKFALPSINFQPFSVVNRFAIKGTYLLI